MSDENRVAWIFFIRGNVTTSQYITIYMKYILFILTLAWGTRWKKATNSANLSWSRFVSCSSSDFHCWQSANITSGSSVSGMDGNSIHSLGIISYSLFADDMGIYPHGTSQRHARPKAKRGIAMLSVDRFQYLQKQTRGSEFIPCSNDVCHILKRFHSFKIPDISVIWHKSSCKSSVTRSHRSVKESGRRSWSSLWRHQ